MVVVDGGGVGKALNVGVAGEDGVVGEGGVGGEGEVSREVKGRQTLEAEGETGGEHLALHAGQFLFDDNQSIR